MFSCNQGWEKMSEHGTIGRRKHFETPLARKKKGEQGEMGGKKKNIESISFISYKRV